MEMGTKVRINGGTKGVPQADETAFEQNHGSMSGKEAFEFIRTCVSHQPEKNRRGSIQSFVESGVDWDVIRWEALRHRVLTSLYHNLETLLGDDLPSFLRDRIQKHRRAVRIHNTFLVQEMGKVFRHFEKHGLPLLTLKGPVLAQVAYGDVALRQSVDLDVVVPPDRFSEAEQLLYRVGYECKDDRKHFAQWQKNLEVRLTGQWPLKRGNGTFTIDLHTHVLPLGYLSTPGFQSFWGRSREIHLEDAVVVRGLSAEDMVMTLCHQGVKDQWCVLRHVCDIAEFVRAEPNIDWELTVQRARKNGATAVLRLGLFMAQSIIRADLPPDVQRWVEDDAATERIGAMMTTYLQNQYQETKLTYRKRVRFQLATKDTIGAQLRYMAYSLLQHLYTDLLSPSKQNTQ